MGIFDEAKNLAEQNSDAVDGGLNKAQQFADEKTGGNFSDEIQQGGDFARGQLGVNSGDSQSQGQQDQGSYNDQGQQDQGAYNDQGQQDQGAYNDQGQQDQGF